MSLGSREEIRMKVPVIFVTGQVGNVQGTMLDHLIAEKEIAAFRRSDGWVQMGHDPMRLAPRPSGSRRNDPRSGGTKD